MDREEKKELLEIARKSVEDAFDGIALEDFPDDGRRMGAFVTIRKNGNLRGCIGYLSGLCALKREIVLLSRDAAFSDYRFPPLSRANPYPQKALSIFPASSGLHIPLVLLDISEKEMISSNDLYTALSFSSRHTRTCFPNLVSVSSIFPPSFSV